MTKEAGPWKDFGKFQARRVGGPTIEWREWETDLFGNKVKRYTEETLLPK